MGTLSNARAHQFPVTGHAGEGQKRTPEGNPYLRTGEIVLTMLDIARHAVIGKEAVAAGQVLARLGLDRRGLYEQVLDMVRRSPADEPVSGVDVGCAT
jgi:hypothetical protein